MAEQAKASGGGIHHRFAVGDGFVLVVDEWETAEHFQSFFANPDLQALIAMSGAAPQPPEITIAEAISSPDEY
jgi:quinol monooxygenase YgiN